MAAAVLPGRRTLNLLLSHSRRVVENLERVTGHCLGAELFKHGFAPSLAECSRTIGIQKQFFDAVG